MSEPVVIIMPAHNEAENLPVVLPELRRYLPDADVVVIDHTPRTHAENRRADEWIDSYRKF